MLKMVLTIYSMASSFSRMVRQGSYSNHNQLLNVSFKKQLSINLYHLTSNVTILINNYFLNMSSTLKHSITSFTVNIKSSRSDTMNSKVIFTMKILMMMLRVIMVQNKIQDRCQTKLNNPYNQKNLHKKRSNNLLNHNYNAVS